MCPMACDIDRMSLGNVYEKDIASIICSQKSRLLAELKSPTYEQCGDCTYLASHMNCVLRTMGDVVGDAAIPDVCPWVNEKQNANAIEHFCATL